MEPLGRFPRVLNGVPREYIEGPPRDFLTANPRPHPRPDPRPKTRGAALRSSRGVLFTTISPRLFHRLSFFPDPEEIKSNKQTNNIKNTANAKHCQCNAHWNLVHWSLARGCRSASGSFCRTLVLWELIFFLHHGPCAGSCWKLISALLTLTVA